MKNNSQTSRRKFIGNATILGALGIAGFSQIIQSCKPGLEPADIDLMPYLDKAPDGEPLRAGVVGLGGRGTGAALNFLVAGNDLSIHAVADVFQDRVDSFRTALKKRAGIEIDDSRCFVGFDGYKRVLESGVNYLIFATPPYFRPEHFQAAVEARKHVFIEKPVAVDPVGTRSVMSTSRQAKAAGLCVVAGTQRRYTRSYIEVLKRIRTGAIGDLVSANVYWNGLKPPHRKPEPGWTEMEAMIRNYGNWCWLSGDHIVDYLIHNIDVINWFTGKFPLEANGVGSRQRRITGDQYDNFFIDYVYEGNMHMGAMTRAINDCSTNVGEYLRGTKGYTNCSDTIWNPDGSIQYTYPFPKNDKGEIDYSRFVYANEQEHINLVAAIRTGNQIVTSEETAKSNMTCIMGRIAAYTGKKVTWDDMMNSELKLGPKVIEMGPVDIDAVIPVPGSSPL